MLLRYERWLVKSLNKRPQKAYLEYRELGVRGWFSVIGFKEIELPGGLKSGTVETTFDRLTNSFYELKLQGCEDPIIGTGNHPIWSLDRKAWIGLASLKTGERLLRAEGTEVVVKSVSSRPGKTRVYNLEVANDHNYYVGRLGILVHNGKGYKKPRYNNRSNKKNLKRQNPGDQGGG